MILPLDVVLLKPVPVQTYEAAAGEQVAVSKTADPNVTGFGFATRLQSGPVWLLLPMPPIRPTDGLVPLGTVYQRSLFGPRINRSGSRPPGTVYIVTCPLGVICPTRFAPVANHAFPSEASAMSLTRTLSGKSNNVNPFVAMSILPIAPRTLPPLITLFEAANQRTPLDPASIVVAAILGMAGSIVIVPFGAILPMVSFTPPSSVNHKLPSAANANE